MGTQLLILSDTHLPTRARALPEPLWDAIGEADIVFHAGDWVGLPLLDELEARSRRVVGVFGNNDGDDLRACLPEIARETIEGVRIAMVHETGQAVGRERRMDAAFPDSDLLIFGHSHIPWDTVTPRGLRLLNPGSPTDRRRQPSGSYLTATITDGRLADVSLVSLAS